MSNFTSRLGDVMSEENLQKVSSLANDCALPTVPYDPSIHELQLLLTYHGNRLAYLIANNELVTNSIKEKKLAVDRAYNAAYKAVVDRNSDVSATTAKSIATQNQKYIDAQNELMETTRAQAKLQSEILALQEQNVCVRKIASLQTLAIEKGIS